MAPILQMPVSKGFFISIRVSLKFVFECPTDNITALVQVMAWSRTGNKPLAEPKLIQLTDTYTGH